MERSDDTGFPITLTDDSMNFDGNPDWAPDGEPVCQAVSLDTRFETPVSVPLNCPNQGPAYERTPVKSFISTDPVNGTLAGDSVGNDPRTVVYTPKAGFTGSDTFDFTPFDDFGFGQRATASIRVLLPGNCANLQTGTAGSDLLIGTIAGDRLRGLRGRDILSGGDGNDCLEGGRGGDRLTGGPGKDRLVGGKGRNTYFGGPGNDRVNARNDRRETIRCGAGRRDRALVDPFDRVRGCERVTRR